MTLLPSALSVFPHTCVSLILKRSFIHAKYSEMFYGQPVACSNGRRWDSEFTASKCSHNHEVHLNKHQIKPFILQK